MSHYSKFQTKFADQACLCQALADKGFTTVEQHAEPVHLFGYHGDRRDDKANVVVRRHYVGSLSNDIGFLRQADGTYEAIISDFDRHKYGEEWLQSLAQRYALHATISSLTQQGYELAEMVEDANGNLRLVLNDYALQ